MNTQNSLTKQDEIKDISSMLLPMQEGYVLLPGSAVAEIVSFVPAIQDEEDAPAWFLGNIQWRNLNIPLISYESLQGGSTPQVAGHCRIAVLNNSGLNQQLDFFAMVIQGTPRLLRIVPDEISSLADKEIKEGEKLYVTVDGEEALIPDVRFMEQAVIDFLELV